jgi:hypothetical protein
MIAKRAPKKPCFVQREVLVADFIPMKLSFFRRFCQFSPSAIILIRNQNFNRRNQFVSQLKGLATARTPDRPNLRCRDRENRRPRTRLARSKTMTPYVPDELPLTCLDIRRLIKKVGTANAAIARYDGLLQSVVKEIGVLCDKRLQIALQIKSGLIHRYGV